MCVLISLSMTYTDVLDLASLAGGGGFVGSGVSYDSHDFLLLAALPGRDTQQFGQTIDT